MAKYKILYGDFRKFTDPMMPLLGKVDTIFADPPDNIGLGYDEHGDRMTPEEYRQLLAALIQTCTTCATTSFISFNARHIALVYVLVDQMIDPERWEHRLLVQGFTFGQHNKHDFGNNFRPILRIRSKNAPLYPDATRVESWRMKNGDKRANPQGRVPGDVWFSDFLDYARVTGNSKQRRRWHPTQLHEGLVEDCLLMSTPEGGTVMDPFCGTGTTLRVCKANGWSCTTMDISIDYCRKVAEENNIPEVDDGVWFSNS